MTEIIPSEIDGAVVSAIKSHQTGAQGCDVCWQVVVGFRNWLQHCQIRYAIFDLMDAKYICPELIQELFLLKRRLRDPFLFCGASLQSRDVLAKYSMDSSFPIFLTPEDAVRALRLRHPDLTEAAQLDPTSLDRAIQFYEDNLVDGTFLREGATASA